MVTLTDRKRSIVKLLSQSEEPVTVERLAAFFRVSPRTIRYDLEDIALWARQQGGVLRVRPRVGVALALPETAPPMEASTYFCPLTVEQRRLLLTVALLSEVRIAPAALAAWLSVSASTVRSDADEVKEWLERRGLLLVSTRTGGYALSGPERAWRRALTEALTQLPVDHAVAGALDTILHGQIPHQGGEAPGDLPLARLDPAVANQLVKLFGPQVVRPVLETVTTMEEDEGLTFADEGLTFLVVHLVIALGRLRLGRVPVIPPEHAMEVRALPTYAMAAALAQRLAGAMNLEIPEAEICYIAMHLLGAKEYIALDRLASVAVGDADRSAALGRAMIGLVENALDCSLSGDRQLLAALITHVRPLINRLRFGIAVSNPLVREIRERYPEIYRACQVAGAVLAREAGIAVLPEDEVGFLAFHFAASLERLHSQRPGPRILVICGSGVGTVRLLLSRLESQFPDLNLVGVGSLLDLHDLTERLLPDLIIATVALEAAACEVLLVHPLLAEADRLRLSLWLERHQQTAALTSTTAAALTGRLNPAGAGASLGASATAAAVLPEGPGLLNLIEPGAVIVGAGAEDWVAAVGLAVAPLVRSGAVDADYGPAIIRAIRERGPYQVIAPGLALLHAAPGQHVHRTAMGLTLLSEGVCFGAGHRDPVWALLALATADTASHLAALREFSNLLIRTDLLDRLRLAKSPAEALDCLQ